MPWKFPVTFSLLSFLFLSQALAGGAVGNGGDMLTCKVSGENPFSGNYTLDFVVSYNKVEEMISEEGNAIEAIWRNLYAKGEERRQQSHLFRNLAINLLLFYRNAQVQLRQGPEYTESIIWLPQVFGLADLQDEDLVQAIPANCQSVIDGKLRPNLQQAVVQEQKGFTFILRYDPSVLKSLPPLQFSYLLLHEWLRNSFSTTRTLRDVVHLLHTQAFHKASAKDAALMLENISGHSQISPPVLRNPLQEEKIQVVSDLQEMKKVRFEGTRGIPINLELSYQPVFQMKCQVLPTKEGKPGAVYGDCTSKVSLMPGETLWISGAIGRPPSATIGIFPLAEAIGDDPDFTFPKF